MLEKNITALREASPYNAAITREQFLFYEMRTTAKLVCEGLSNDEIADRIVKENLFQCLVETLVKRGVLTREDFARACVLLTRKYGLPADSIFAECPT